MINSGGDRRAKLSGFSLLEVLIAVGVLFIVGSSVVSLSNSLIQGTVKSADSTVVNLWGAEGLEIVTKIRDDNLRKASQGEAPTWLAAAEDSALYGWYELKYDNSTKQWQMSKASGLGNDSSFKDYYNAVSGEVLSSEGLVAKRYICVEAVGAKSPATNTNVRCNTSATGSEVSDGLRTSLSACDAEDAYCLMTASSLSRNREVAKVIPAGNALKIRSVLVWPQKNEYRIADMVTILTNWKGTDQ